jgi:hypothetical protein
MSEVAEEITDFLIEQKKKCRKHCKTKQREDFLQESMPQTGGQSKEDSQDKNLSAAL